MSVPVTPEQHQEVDVEEEGEEADTDQSQKTVLGKRTIWIPILILTKISASQE